MSGRGWGIRAATLGREARTEEREEAQVSAVIRINAPHSPGETFGPRGHSSVRQRRSSRTFLVSQLALLTAAAMMAIVVALTPLSRLYGDFQPEGADGFAGSPDDPEASGTVLDEGLVRRPRRGPLCGHTRLAGVDRSGLRRRSRRRQRCPRVDPGRPV